MAGIVSLWWTEVRKYPLYPLWILVYQGTLSGGKYLRILLDQSTILPYEETRAHKLWFCDKRHIRDTLVLLVPNCILCITQSGFHCPWRRLLWSKFKETNPERLSTFVKCMWQWLWVVEQYKSWQRWWKRARFQAEGTMCKYKEGGKGVEMWVAVRSSRRLHHCERATAEKAGGHGQTTEGAVCWTNLTCPSVWARVSQSVILQLTASASPEIVIKNSAPNPFLRCRELFCVLRKSWTLLFKNTKVKKQR